MARILVVDDEIEACNVLEEFLSSKGHDVHTALDGPTAISKFQKVNPQLVFLDMIMPGMGGLDVLKEIKKIDADVTVIMVTVVTDHEQARETIASGAYDYITKPVDLNYLENLIMVKLME
ncbi:MAG: response regulator [Desulfobacteraceae bacterium]|jgi:DNA-binding NtrC family response regulator